MDVCMHFKLRSSGVNVSKDELFHTDKQRKSAHIGSYDVFQKLKCPVRLVTKVVVTALLVCSNVIQEVEAGGFFQMSTSNCEPCDQRCEDGIN